MHLHLHLVGYLVPGCGKLPGISHQERNQLVLPTIESTRKKNSNFRITEEK